MSSHCDSGQADAARSSTTAPRLRWVLVVGLLVANSLFFALGVLAAVLGGSLSDWGEGAGGLGGGANELMTYFSFLVGFAAAIATFRERRAVLVSAQWDGARYRQVGIYVSGGWSVAGRSRRVSRILQTSISWSETT